jgi:uncharacterized membrane protein
MFFAFDFWEFTNSWYFIGTLLALLVVLIGVFILLRVLKKDEE